MARKKISIAEYNALRQDMMDAKTDLAECSALFAEAEECQVMDNCLTCKGTGKVEDEYATNNGSMNPYGKVIYKDCPTCEGRGYTDVR